MPVVRYSCLSLDAIKALPVPSLLDATGGMVAVWVTNNPAFVQWTAKTLLPAWGCEHVATWYWVKVTDAGDLVVPLERARLHHRIPVERIIIGRLPCPCRSCQYKGSKLSHARVRSTSYELPRLHPKSLHSPSVPSRLAFFSVPGIYLLVRVLFVSG